MSRQFITHRFVASAQLGSLKLLLFPRFIAQNSFSGLASIMTGNIAKKPKLELNDSSSNDIDNSLLSKYRGCMLSALIGDCLGAPYEQDYWDEFPSESQITTFISQLLSPSLRVPFKSYTDDTAMTLAVAESLLEKRGFDAEHMARKFVSVYYSEPGRGYGRNVGEVFRQLGDQDCREPLVPATKQFDNQGSYGNGGAMRVSPVALMCCDNVDALIDTTSQQAQITHAHHEGFHGAVLQCLAVHTALTSDASQPLDVCQYLATLTAHLATLQQSDKREQPDRQTPYTHALKVVSKLVKQQQQGTVTRAEVVDLLGHDISAVGSVPTAIYCFLRHALSHHSLSHSASASQSQDSQQQCVNTLKSPILNTIKLAISLGGDTDTVASMAGAIAGAYWGDNQVPRVLANYCEAADQAVSLATQIYRLKHKH